MLLFVAAAADLARGPKDRDSPGPGGNRGFGQVECSVATLSGDLRPVREGKTSMDSYPSRLILILTMDAVVQEEDRVREGLSKLSRELQAWVDVVVDVPTC